MKNKILEFFGHSTRNNQISNWREIIEKQICPYTNKKCFKVRKSNPDISIGTCTVRYGRDEKDIIICPHRLLNKNQVFMDSIHLLTLHEPGNELHVVSEISIPGGSVDYFLTSVKKGKVKDFVGIEFQSLDTTGTVWPERQRLLKELDLFEITDKEIDDKSFGMNWKMTAKTILVQLHHKIYTLEHFSKHMVLVVQDYFLSYMKKNFNFCDLHEPIRIGDSMQFHSYELECIEGQFKLNLSNRLSTDSEGIAKSLGLKADPKIELETIIKKLEDQISSDTLLTL